MSVNLIFTALIQAKSKNALLLLDEIDAFLTSLAGLLIVLFWIVPYIYELFETMQSLFAL